MRILLFDGTCNLCNGAVQFLIKRDHQEVLKFSSLQSKFGEKVIAKYELPKTLDSFVYIKDGYAYTKSTAALNICKDLGGIYKLAFLFICIPKRIRDDVYDLVAKNRYKWFGTSESCMLPTPDLKRRFIDDNEDII